MHWSRRIRRFGTKLFPPSSHWLWLDWPTFISCFLIFVAMVTTELVMFWILGYSDNQPTTWAVHTGPILDTCPLSVTKHLCGSPNLVNMKYTSTTARNICRTNISFVPQAMRKEFKVKWKFYLLHSLQYMELVTATTAVILLLRQHNSTVYRNSSTKKIVQINPGSTNNRHLAGTWNEVVLECSTFLRETIAGDIRNRRP
jgi:hypothetical protein